MVIGFAWGGWVTGSTSQTRSDAAVLASQAAICVAQVVKDRVSLKNWRGSKAIRDPNSSKKEAGTKCRGKKKPTPVSQAHVLMGLEVLIKK